MGKKPSKPTPKPKPRPPKPSKGYRPTDSAPTGKDVEVTSVDKPIFRSVVRV